MDRRGVLGFSALVSGLIFGVPGLASVVAGVIAGRFIGRFGSAKVLTVALAVQGLATLPLVFVGPGRIALAILIPALFVGFFAHVTSLVAYTVAGTSGLPNQEQGLATGLTSMTQQVAIAVGIPILSSIAATQRTELTGIHLALTVDVAVTLLSVLLIWLGLRGTAGPASKEPVQVLATTSDQQRGHPAGTCPCPAGASATATPPTGLGAGS